MKNCAQLQKWIFYLFIQNPKCASHSKWCHQMLQNDVIKCCKMMSPHGNEPATWRNCVSRRHFWSCHFRKKLLKFLQGVTVIISQKRLFKHINSLQCYELTRRCSHLPLCIDFFTIDLFCMPLVCALWMCIDAEIAINLSYLHFLGY